MKCFTAQLKLSDEKLVLAQERDLEIENLGDKDIEVGKQQDCVKQLQQVNSEAKMLLDKQELKHKITVDVFKQEVGFACFMSLYCVHFELLPYVPFTFYMLNPDFRSSL